MQKLKEHSFALRSFLLILKETKRSVRISEIGVAEWHLSNSLSQVFDNFVSVASYSSIVFHSKRVLSIIAPFKH